MHMGQGCVTCVTPGILSLVTLDQVSSLVTFSQVEKRLVVLSPAGGKHHFFSFHIYNIYVTGLLQTYRLKTDGNPTLHS